MVYDFDDLESDPPERRADGCGARLALSADQIRAYNKAYSRAKRKLGDEHPDWDEAQIDGQAVQHATDYVSAEKAKQEAVARTTSEKEATIDGKINELIATEGIKRARGFLMATMGEFADVRWLGGTGREFGQESVEGVSNAYFRKALDMISPLFRARKNMLGVSEVNQRELVEAIKDGADNGASDLAQAYNKYSEWQRVEYNKALGAEVLGKNSEWHMPQLHPREKILAFGSRDEWIKLIQPLVVDQDGYALDGEVLARTWDKIVTEANQTPIILRHRSFKFKNADAWLKYHNSLGMHDVFEILVEHMRAMTRRTAIAKIFGDRPEEIVDRLIRKFNNQGETFLADDAMLRRMVRKMTGVYDALAAKEPKDLEVIANPEGWDKTKEKAKIFAQVYVPAARGMYAVWKMSHSVFSTISEVGHMFYKGGFYEIPAVRTVGNIFRVSGGGREKMRQQALAMGFLTDSINMRLRSISRFSGEAFEPGHLNRAKNGLLEATGFQMVVDTMKVAYGFTWLEHISRHLDMDYDALTEQMRKGLARRGIGAKQWKDAQDAFAGGASSDIEWGGGSVKMLSVNKMDTDKSLIWQSALAAESEQQSGNASWMSDVLIGGSGQRGTLAREARETTGMFLRYPVNTTLFNIIPAFTNGSTLVKRNAAVLVGMTIMGYYRYQIMHYLKNDEAPPPMETAGDYMGVLAVSLAYGGGGGLLAEWFFPPSSFTRGQTPIAGLADSVGWQAIEDIRQGGVDVAEYLLDEHFFESQAVRDEGKSWRQRAKDASPLWMTDFILRGAVADEVYRLRSLGQ